MQHALEFTNAVAAVLNLVVAAVFLSLSRSRVSQTRLPTILAAFFLLRAVDRMTNPSAHLLPYSAVVDLATNVALVVLLVTLAVGVYSYVRSVSGRLDEAHALANRDSLTGLHNRRGWERLLKECIADARARNQSLVLMLLDLDHFKRLNDEQGHAAGDEVLKASATAWSDVVREQDVLGRYGGEEFIAVLPGSSPETAADIAERLRGATPLGQTCSIGVATWDGLESIEALIARADAALYRAKTGGRDQVVVDGPAVATG